MHRLSMEEFVARRDVLKAAAPDSAATPGLTAPGPFGFDGWKHPTPALC